MIVTIVILLFAFYWLMRETDWLTIVLTGEVVDYRKRWFATFEPVCGEWILQSLNTLVTENTEPRQMPTGYVIEQSLKRTARTNGHYEIIVSPAIEDVLCGREWLDEHWNDLADYTPEIEMLIGGVNYHMVIKQPEAIAKVMKVNKLSKQEKLKYVTA